MQAINQKKIKLRITAFLSIVVLLKSYFSVPTIFSGFTHLSNSAAVT